ncbi:MAG: pilus (MSHA type) biogenesis protein MshL [Candidatus Nitricoxidivorans perseverans]|uniref:Pilus (MSHA type) biogenesis protein MshL n=1 Tax=Candidatus Nitricoxidivorans perseverans TaxID=2975601 RepID=A0AA49IY15_9PROT|nr:MAG: pilus (MSHA type) biogenesis protein MshL [Candidatus Nitricoxidivorans perseverans]
MRAPFYRIAAILSALALLMAAGCGTRQTTKPGVAYDAVASELARATAERKTPPSLDRAMLPPLRLEAPKAAEAEPRFDLSVVNAPANQVFMALVNGTKYSMLVGPDLAGSITVNLKNTTLLEALDTIRELYGYDYRLQGDRIFIQPNSLQTRIFSINYLASRRQGASSLRVTSSSISGTSTTGGTTTATSTGGTGASQTSSGATETSRVSMSSETDFWRDIITALTAIVGTSEGRNVIVNPMSGVLVVRAFPADIRNVENYLKATRLVVERQVMLEAKILDVALNDESQSGVNWSAFASSGNTRGMAGVTASGTSLPATGSSASMTSGSGPELTLTPGKAGSIIASAVGKGFIGLAFQAANFATLLNFLETQGNVTVLSSPRIATLNNQKAVLKVGTDELFVTNVTTTTTTTTTGSTATPSLTLQPYFSGISLDVTPQIDEDGNIILHVHPAVSTVAEKEKIIDLGSMGQYKLPLASSSINETDSIVRVQDGNIVAIGGLMKQEQTQDRTGLPGSSGSGASALLGQRSGSMKKRELVILIKPTLIRDDRAWQQDLQETYGRMKALDPRQKPPQSAE